MNKLRVKIQLVPVYCICIFISGLILGTIANSLLTKGLDDSVDKNYQVVGMIDGSSFAMLRAYYENNYLIIENQVDGNDTYSIDTKKIYYELKTDIDDKVLDSGYLTTEIKVKKNKINADGNIVIYIYAIKDKSELKSEEPTYEIIIDKDEIYEYMDIGYYLRKYDNLDERELEQFNSYLNVNYLNDRIVKTYYSDVQKFVMPYIKAPQNDKVNELSIIVDKLEEKYKYYKHLASLVDVNFDKILKNISESSHYYYHYLALKSNVDYINNLLEKEIQVLENEALNNGENLKQYYEQKDNYPLQEQYEYLKKL